MREPVGGGYWPWIPNGSSPTIDTKSYTTCHGMQSNNWDTLPQIIKNMCNSTKPYSDTHLKLIYKLSSLWVLLQLKKKKDHRHDLSSDASPKNTCGKI